MNVALLGPQGTYTHQAAKICFDGCDPVFCSSILDVFNADTERAIVPFENSLGGGVAETIDQLRSHDVRVSGEQRMRVKHCLLSEESTVAAIHTVKSHPQALAQCRGFIDKHGWQTHATASTAEAAIGLRSGEAAIASHVASDIYDLNVLRDDIQANSSNTTRFLILGGEATTGAKTAFIIEPDEDKPGLLEKVLSCFSEHNINLSYIQSRPKRTELGEYFFFIEAQANRESDSFQKAVTCAKTYANATIIGSYD